MRQHLCGKCGAVCRINSLLRLPPIEQIVCSNCGVIRETPEQMCEPIIVEVEPATF